MKDWSPQQHAIYGEFKTGTDNVVVEAFAGCGKTTTILEAINHAPESRILLAAFNKRIQEELQARLGNTNAQAKTLHGLGFSFVTRYWERVQVERRQGRGQLSRAQALTERACGAGAPDAIKKLVTTLHTKAREICPQAKNATLYDDKVMVIRGDLYDLMFDFDCVPDAEWVAEGFDLSYVEVHALKAMEIAAEEKPVTGIDFADMIYLPLRNRWLRPMFDLVVVDEAQDMTAAQLELAEGVCAGRLVLVGDPNQAIYGFRGADSQSLSRLRVKLNARVFPLSVTYRCGRAIVAAAQSFVPGFTAAETNSPGDVQSITYRQIGECVDLGDFVLSRTNAPLVACAMALIRAKKRARVAGRDIGSGLKALLHKLTRAKKVNSVPAFLERLGTWAIKETERAVRAGQERQVDVIADRAETLRTLADGAIGLKEIEDRIDDLFTDDGLGSLGVITCSSVHKAKGLEANRVFVLRDTLNRKMGKKPKTPAQEQEEKNIEYVAITRARNILVWVIGLPGDTTPRARTAEAAKV